MIKVSQIKYKRTKGYYEGLKVVQRKNQATE